MLKRSKGQISNLSLLQHCSSNRNRNCWRPEKSDLKRFRSGKTHRLLQEGFCYCSPKDSSASLLISWLCVMLLSAFSFENNWSFTPGDFSRSFLILVTQGVFYHSCFLLNAKIAVFLLAIKGQIVKNHSLHPFLF